MNTINKSINIFIGDIHTDKENFLHLRLFGFLKSRFEKAFGCPWTDDDMMDWEETAKPVFTADFYDHIIRAPDRQDGGFDHWGGDSVLKKACAVAQSTSLRKANMIIFYGEDIGDALKLKPGELNSRYNLVNCGIFQYSRSI